MNQSVLNQWGVWDDRMSRRFRIAESPGLLRTTAAILAHSGDSWFWMAGLALLWLWGDGSWKARSLVFSVGILVTALLVMVLKFTIRRKRPAGDWGNIYRATDPHSFPSGHAARATMLALLACSFNVAWLGWALVIWAPLVSLARVAMGLHYLSDVIAGMIIGILIGMGILFLI
jgi:membrane-associated phospholipid phosphatase